MQAGILTDAARALELAVTAVGGDPSSSAGSGKQRKRTRGGDSEAGLERTTRVPPSTRSPAAHLKRERAEGMFKTDRNGLEICFNYAKHGQCVEPCASGRAHCCQTCLGPHTNVECLDNRKGNGVGKSKNASKPAPTVETYREGDGVDAAGAHCVGAGGVQSRSAADAPREKVCTGASNTWEKRGCWGNVLVRKALGLMPLGEHGAVPTLPSREIRSRDVEVTRNACLVKKSKLTNRQRFA